MLHTTSQEKVTKIVSFPWFLACCDGTWGQKNFRMVLFWWEEHEHGREKRNNLFPTFFSGFLQVGKNGSRRRYGLEPNRDTTKFSFLRMKRQFISILKCLFVWSCGFWFSCSSPKGQLGEVLDFFCADGSWGWQSGRTDKWTTHLWIKTKFPTL